MDAKQPTFEGIESAAQSLGVPMAWLRQEANANRIPHLRANRRYLFYLDAVRTALIERARDEKGGQVNDR